MKLFLVLYVAGKISLVVGPIPETPEQCQTRAETILNDLVENDLLLDGLSVAIGCELHEEKPVLEWK